jgi:hypothetical protein
MSSAVRKEDVRFLEFALSRVAMAAGASQTHADYIAQAICFAHLQGKLNQGLGVYEVLDLSIKSGILDMSSTPELSMKMLLGRSSMGIDPLVTTPSM